VCTSPFGPGESTNASVVMPNVGTNYRIPVVISRNGVVNILAENRGGSGSDSGRHKLALVRSTDSGQSFTSVDNIYNDSLTGPAKP
jgi:hypothetical protein